MAIPSSFEDIRDTLTFLDDWEEKYGYIIDLGRHLPPMLEADKTPEHLVRGCASQVWLVCREMQVEGVMRLSFEGDSDALIVKGLVAITLALFFQRTPHDILQVDAQGLFAQLGLSDQLTAQRANGLAAMVQRIQAEARQRL